MIPDTMSRVLEHTARHINEDIQRQIAETVWHYAEHPEGIDARLAELNREWDIERVLEVNAAGFSLLGLTLGMTVDRRWLALPLGVATFLLQHAVQGWCPPVPLFRRLGVRTAAEIDEERYALKALRGDFSRVCPPFADAEARAQAALRAVRGQAHQAHRGAQAEA